jgi:hypothetical protein
MNMTEYGPQVTARHGSKRWFAQVRARRIFLAVMESAHRADAKRAGEREAQARAAVAEGEANVAAIATLILVLSEPASRA